ncbi:MULTISPECIES: glyoxylate/hydroxypyruvate reductase A [unclassified Variovorax]|jgi:glyoxylate/hydroxypyruvate reductase A|uniref:2-hydroxyacid dehydrogenase n=1 Tax=unclassified Variovorax TaxID=663243 RepID=UPI000F7EA9D5|nr:MULTISPECIES: glyoxylate/hydroxypyruvate reductase A [unclassified Variovorax]RSZ33847.1 glyoxylate/hydroxypyruvate reductase A [Variovorax sp. 553]RSZ34156.1 glyoxylate/hydroxypyruvate reductase A [Variovorax sp. 679]
MTLNIALVSDQIAMGYLQPAFRERFPQARLLRIDTEVQELDALEEIDTVVCWSPPPGLLARMPRLRLVQSVGAGIDHITRDPALPDVPVRRIVDADMADGMNAYVAWAVVHGQRHMGAYLESQRRAAWEEAPIEPPGQHRVGIAGLGVLGQSVARVLDAIGYRVRGWSRSPKDGLPASIEAFHGDAARAEFLAGCDTLVCLLPLTDDTRGILDAALFAQLPRGARLVNAGRGAHLVQEDLLAALHSGQIASAVLDAFVEEPLPAAHPFWHHPRITVTPHIATRTRPEAIARQTHDNLARL